MSGKKEQEAYMGKEGGVEMKMHGDKKCDQEEENK